LDLRANEVSKVSLEILEERVQLERRATWDKPARLDHPELRDSRVLPEQRESRELLEFRVLKVTVEQ
jgi:hypothetical protein